MPAPSIRIRRAIPTDETAIRACISDAYQRYIERMPAPPAPMLADYRALISREAVFVARAGDALLGVIVLWPETDHLYIDNIAVASAAQGQGVGRLLLEFAENAARQADRSEIRLYTNEAMAENLDFYPRRGFIETHRAIDTGYRRVYFTRHLPPPS